jgi:hypothetical protein
MLTVKYPASKREFEKHYPGCDGPQAVIVELDPERETLSIRYDPEIGGSIPMSVYHGRIRWYVLLVRPRSVREACCILRSFREYAERIIEGHTVEWNGNNHVGRLTEDAQAAEDEIYELISSYRPE